MARRKVKSNEEIDWQGMFDEALARPVVAQDPISPEVLMQKYPNKSLSYCQTYSRMLQAMAEFLDHPEADKEIVTFWMGQMETEGGTR